MPEKPPQAAEGKAEITADPALAPTSEAASAAQKPRRSWARRTPGLEKPKRFRPRFHWELLVCGVSGHELVGLDARELRPEDAPFARERDGVRWLRCLRCDSWLPLEPPEAPACEHPPAPEEIELPLRGKALRDKVVLRLIAVDRAIHFVALAVIAVVIFLFRSHEARLRQLFHRAVEGIQGTSGGPARIHGGLLGKLDHYLNLHSSTLAYVGLAAALYALLEGAEAVGLWYQRRWAEYLTFLATVLLLPLEVYELTSRVSYLKILALVINLVIAAYLLWAKRLFGLNGGAQAEERLREADMGWEAVKAAAPPAEQTP